MATSKPYAAITRQLGRRIAEAFLERMGLCPCAGNVRAVERTLLPILEMFENDIAACGKVGANFAVDHLATYLARCDEEMARPLHKAGQSATAASHTPGGAAHGIDQ